MIDAHFTVGDRVRAERKDGSGVIVGTVTYARTDLAMFYVLDDFHHPSDKEHDDEHMVRLDRYNIEVI